MNAEVTAIDSVSRRPLLLLLASGLAWLLLAGVLGLIAAAQLVQPGFLGGCEWLTYGRMVALAETTFVYGWLANVGLALALWILARLGGEALRAQNWIVAGALFWNLGITLALVGIATGDATGFSLLNLPRYVQPLLLVAYGTIAVSGILAWGDRKRSMMYASQWYAVAALFLFPWFFSVAQVMLFWVPARGVVQAVVAGWYAQAAWTLWLAPLALAVAYYVVPKVTGRTVRSYGFASLGFWTLLFLGAWTGGRHLIGGPVPVWIPTVAIVAGVLLFFHYMIVALNLRDAFGGGGASLKFIGFGLAAYLLGGFVDALTSFHGFAMITQFTYADAAEQQLALYGAVSMIFFGGLYYALPRIWGQPWAYASLIRGHMGCSIIGVVILVLSLGIGGIVQGGGLLSDKVSFEEIAGLTHPWLLAAMFAQAVLLFGNVLLTFNFVFTLALSRTAATAQFRPAVAMEASAS
jgi:cytochrome c oxidase cbb3-type subunit 1